MWILVGMLSLLLLEPILSPFWAAWIVGELPAAATWVGGVLDVVVRRGGRVVVRFRDGGSRGRREGGHGLRGADLLALGGSNLGHCLL